MTHVIILAAGKGKRMNSNRPKVLTEVAGRPIILRLLDAVVPVCPKPTIIIGRGGEEVMKTTGDRYHYVWQKEQLGTGHAVLQAKSFLAGEDFKNIIVLLGDHPLISTETLKNLIASHETSGTVITMVTIRVQNYVGDGKIFNGFGRVIRGIDGGVERIVEFKDATEGERAIVEVNPSYYCFDAKWLWENIGRIENKNAAQEYYLTDLVGIATGQGRRVFAMVIKDPVEGMGVNTPEELAIVERHSARR